MRFVLCLALLVSACTRANPDAIGGSGGGGAAGSGGGGGGAAGGGGVGGGSDLAVSTPDDLATNAPPDMTSFKGVYCGNNVCVEPTGECCATQTTVVCQSPALQCIGRSFDCDGPEDCQGQRCCGSTNGSGCATGGANCPSGDFPLCHTVADCAGSGGYVACCAASNGGHLRFCSKNPCM